MHESPPQNDGAPSAPEYSTLSSPPPVKVASQPPPLPLERAEQGAAKRRWIVCSGVTIACLVIFYICLTVIMPDAFMQARGVTDLEGLIPTALRAAGQLVGTSAGVALLIAGILALFKKPFGRMFAVAYTITTITLTGFNILALPILAKILTNLSAAKTTTADSTSTTANATSTTANSTSANTDNGVHVSKSFTKTPEFAAAERTFSERSKSISRINQNYTAALSKIGMPTILAGNRLKNDPDLSGARTIFANYKFAEKLRRELITKEMDNYAAALSSIPRSPSTNQNDYETYFNFQKRDLETMRKAYQKGWEVEDAGQILFQSAIDLLAKAQGTWQVNEANMIEFQNEEDRQGYEAIMAELGNIAAAAKKIQEKPNSGK